MFKTKFLLVLAICAVSYEIIFAKPATASDIKEINALLSKLKMTLKKINDTQVRIASLETRTNSKHITKAADLKNRSVRIQNEIVKTTKLVTGYTIKNAGSFSYLRERSLKKKIFKILDFRRYWRQYQTIKSHGNKKRLGIYAESNMINKKIWPLRNLIRAEVAQLKATTQKYPIPKTMTELNQLDSNIYFLSKQVQSQQFNEFEKARTDGNSGLKQIQTKKVGRRNYLSNDFSGDGVAGINDNLATTEDNVATTSFSASLNGIEFRTKCCGYKLQQSKFSNGKLHATTSVPFPNLPGNHVFINGTADEQIIEMREWFKAFQNQDSSHRDYKAYFRPLITYLEGAWMHDENDFMGDENLAKFQYMSETGFTDETLEYLPKTIIGFNEKTKNSIYARFSYRFVARQIGFDVKKKYLIPIYDPASQKRLQKSWRELLNSHAARFDLNGVNSIGKSVNGSQHFTMLDRIMGTVAGKDNRWSSSSPVRKFPFSSYTEDQCFSANPKNYKELDKSYYHRSYKGTRNTHEQVGFSDRVYVAQTSQTSVAGPSITLNSEVFNVKNSYAVPVEMIFLTPLHKWNPYKIAYKENCSDVTGDGSKANPYSASCPELNYKTPASFFTGEHRNECDVKLDKTGVHVMRGDGTIGCFYPSGINVVLPNIFGIDGRIRQRYPIMPLEAEGGPTWKKIDALIDTIDIQFTFSTGTSAFFGKPHSHTVKISKLDIEYLKLNPDKHVKKATVADILHQHILSIKMASKGELYISDCNSGVHNSTAGTVCFDKHLNSLTESSL